MLVSHAAVLCVVTKCFYRLKGGELREDTKN